MEATKKVTIALIIVFGIWLTSCDFPQNKFIDNKKNSADSSFHVKHNIFQKDEQLLFGVKSYENDFNHGDIIAYEEQSLLLLNSLKSQSI